MCGPKENIFRGKFQRKNEIANFQRKNKIAKFTQRCLCVQSLLFGITFVFVIMDKYQIDL